MRLVWAPFALADRDEIFSYVEADNPKAAAEIDERIASAVRRLLRFPESGRPGRVAGTRELLLKLDFMRRIAAGERATPED